MLVVPNVPVSFIIRVCCSSYRIPHMLKWRTFISYVIVSDALKTWWPALTSLQSLLRVFFHLPARQRCLRDDLNFEFLSFVPSSKVLTYLVINQLSCPHSSIMCNYDTCMIFLYFLGVIPKTVMDSMEFLMNFHIPKDVKIGYKRRHSLKGYTKQQNIPTKNKTAS